MIKTPANKTKAKVCIDPKPGQLQMNIIKMLALLNSPETKCEFWKSIHPDFHIMGVRPVTKTTVEILNQNGYNPYEKKIDEIFFKYYKIYIVDSIEPYNMTLEDLEKKKEIEKNGTIYLKSHDLIWIVDYIRNRS